MLGGFADAWRAMSPARFAASLALRVATLGVNVGCTIMAARAFGLDIPAGAMAAGLPVIYVVGVLPLNVLGLGVVTAAWVAVFERFASGADILAFQFLYQALSIAMTVARGLPFLPLGPARHRPPLLPLTAAGEPWVTRAGGCAGGRRTRGRPRSGGASTTWAGVPSSTMVPRSMTQTRLAMSWANCISWVTTSMVMPALREARG